MVVVAPDGHRLVVVAVTVDDDAPFPGDRVDDPRKVEAVAEAEFGRPLEDERDPVGLFDIAGKVVRRPQVRRPIDRNLMQGCSVLAR
jgi:hypothetical protein